MTEAEADCWELAAELAGKLFELPLLHPMDKQEIATAIHVIQHRLLSRPTYRKYKDAVKEFYEEALRPDSTRPHERVEADLTVTRSPTMHRRDLLRCLTSAAATAVSGVGPGRSHARAGVARPASVPAPDRPEPAASG